MAWSALGRAVFGYFLMPAHPALAHCVKTVRPPAYGVRNRVMADVALGNGAGITLKRNALVIISGFGTGINGMGSAVTGLTLKPPVPLAESKQTGARHGRIGVRGKSCVLRAALGFDQALSVGMAALTIGFRQPSHTPRGAHIRDPAVATLTGHPAGAVRVYRNAHRISQTLGFRARMATVAGGSIVNIIETLPGRRVQDPGVQSVDAGGEGSNAPHAGAREGVGSMTCRA